MIDSLSLGLSRTGAVAPSGAASAAAATSGSVAGPSFAEVMAEVANDTVDTLRRAETASIAGIEGQASALEVVEAIKAAEQALHTATAMRDKMVQAYQEVSRMQI